MSSYVAAEHFADDRLFSLLSQSSLSVFVD